MTTDGKVIEIPQKLSISTRVSVDLLRDEQVAARAIRTFFTTRFSQLLAPHDKAVSSYPPMRFTPALEVLGTLNNGSMKYIRVMATAYVENVLGQTKNVEESHHENVETKRSSDVYIRAHDDTPPQFERRVIDDKVVSMCLRCFWLVPRRQDQSFEEAESEHLGKCIYAEKDPI